MKNLIFGMILFVSFLACCFSLQNAFSEEIDNLKDRKLEKTETDRTMLIERSKSGHIPSILKLGQCGEKADVKMLKEKLKEIEKNEGDDFGKKRALRKAIARIGDEQARKEIIKDMKSERKYVYSQAIGDATYVGGADMIASVADLLFDDKRHGGRPVIIKSNGEKRVVNDVIIPAPRYLAVQALRKMVDESPVSKTDMKRDPYTGKDVEEWRKWWTENKHKYTVDESVKSDIPQATGTVSTNLTK